MAVKARSIFWPLSLMAFGLLLLCYSDGRAAGHAPATQPSNLEFHIVADTATANRADLAKMVARLEPGGSGPLTQPGDTIRWFEVQHAEDFDQPGSPAETRTWNGRSYLPLLVTADASMDHENGAQWRITQAKRLTSDEGGLEIAFTFDQAGRKAFGELTSRWFKKIGQRKDLLDPHARLGIVLNDKIISAPNINTPITGGSGVIVGGVNGFSDVEADRIISGLMEINVEN